MLYTLIKSLAAIIFKVLFRIKINGLEHIPKKGGFILASNHLSYLDPIVLGVACPRKLNFMAKQELFRNALFSLLIYNVGAFPVKRDSADLSALKEAMYRVKNGRVLALFPEGTRKTDTDFNKPFPGIGFLVAKLAVPVIPVFIRGTGSAFPKGARSVRAKRISVYFGRPRSYYSNGLDDLKKERQEQISLERRLPYQEIAQSIMEDIRRLSL